VKNGGARFARITSIRDLLCHSRPRENGERGNPCSLSIEGEGRGEGEKPKYSKPGEKWVYKTAKINQK